jgi:hypothetical protein
VATVGVGVGSRRSRGFRIRVIDRGRMRIGVIVMVMRTRQRPLSRVGLVSMMGKSGIVRIRIVGVRKMLSDSLRW